MPGAAHAGFSVKEMSEHFFVRVPENLYDAMRHGEITPVMFNVMCLLHRWANWHTGVVRTCSAQRLAAAMGGDSFDGTPDQIPSIRTIQRSMQGLCEAGWLISGYCKGSKKPYSVEICNYIPVAEGDADVTLIRPTETKSWAETSVCRVADEDGEGTVSGRGKGGLNETSSETSYETSFETSTGGVSESSKVESPTSSASDDSGTDSTPIEEPRQVSIDEWELAAGVVETHTGVRPNQTLLCRIFNSHPDFIWTHKAYEAVNVTLSQKSWQKSIKTPDDFAYRWASDGGTSLFAQVCRNLPDENPIQGSAPEPETIEQTTARTRAFEIYDGCEIPAVVDAFAKKDARYRRFPELYGYHNGTTWKLGSDLEQVQENCDSEKEKVTA